MLVAQSLGSRHEITKAWCVYRSRNDDSENDVPSCTNNRWLCTGLEKSDQPILDFLADLTEYDGSQTAAPRGPLQVVQKCSEVKVWLVSQENLPFLRAIRKINVIAGTGYHVNALA